MQRPIAFRSPAAALTGAFIAAAALLAQPARAGEGWSDDHVEWDVPPHGWQNAVHTRDAAPPSVGDRDEVLEKPGAIMTGFAVGTLVGGGVTLGVAEHGEENCGLTGCFRRSNIHARMAAASMFTGGLAMGLIAVPCWLAGRSSRPWARKSDRRMATGIALTTVGSGSLAISALMLVAWSDPHFLDGRSREDTLLSDDRILGGSFIPILVQGAAGAGMLATGVALWGSGARTPPALRGDADAIDAELQLGAGTASLELRF